MSDIIVNHFYGVEVEDHPLRPELMSEDDDYIDTMDYIIDSFAKGKLPIGKQEKDAFISWGPNSAIQIGYNMIAPFETPAFTKKELDDRIFQIVEYLFGTDVAKKSVPEKIFYGYDEDENY